MTNDTTLFEGKPDWYKGYALSIAEYVVTSELSTVRSYGAQYSTLAKHMRSCKIETLWSLDDEVSAFTESDSYDFTYASLEASVSVRFTCACGEYANAKAEVQDSLGNVISALTYKG